MGEGTKPSGSMRVSKPRWLATGHTTCPPSAVARPRNAGAEGGLDQRSGKAAPPALSISRATAFAPPILPVPLTRFFGREAELEQLCGQLESSEGRLLTLTGPGGSGKTRLALEVSHRLKHCFAGRVWFLTLAEWNAPDRIEDAFAHVLSLPPAKDGSVREQIAHFLGEAPALLTLDNFEHLVELGAESVRCLLETIPHLHCLVTSRECLLVPGEREIALAPLPIPSGVERPEDLPACPSVALFQDRARAIRPGFRSGRP